MLTECGIQDYVEIQDYLVLSLHIAREGKIKILVLHNSNTSAGFVMDLECKDNKKATSKGPRNVDNLVPGHEHRQNVNLR